MSDAAPAAIAAAPPDPSLYPHHRDCIRCGYDLFGQPLGGVCPECGSKVQKTASRPLWHATNPRALARTRGALQQISLSIFAMAAVSVMLLLADAMNRVGSSIEKPIRLLSSLIAVGCALAFFTGLVLLSWGVGSPVWRRWMPLVTAVSTTVWLIAGSELTAEGGRQMPLINASIAAALFWLIGVAMQAAVASATLGLPDRIAAVRARRFLVVTRVMLLIPVLGLWATTSLMYLFAERAAMRLFGDAASLLLNGSPIILGLWLLLASIHWLRLLRFLQPPRTLEP